MRPFRMIALEPATSIYANGITAAARKIVRTPGLEDDLEAAIRSAAPHLPISPEFRAAYRGQAARSHEFVESHDFGMMQTYSGATVPLIRQDWVRTVTVPAPAFDLLPDLLRSMRFEPEEALRLLNESPNARVDLVGGKLSIHAPNEPSLGSLLATVHELGHFYYESAAGHPDPGSFSHYMESEAAALSFCYAGVLTFLVEFAGRVPRDIETWEEYVLADRMLNHYFFLEEAKVLGQFEGSIPPMGMKFLRDNRTTMLGYQIVYAAASTLAGAHAFAIVESLRNGTRHPSHMMRAIARKIGATDLYS
jgi:hypothetical protein